MAPRRLAALTALSGAAVTLVAVLVPSLYLAYRLPALRGSVESAVAVAAALVAFLVFGRSHRHEPRDRIVAFAFGAFALANVVLSLVARLSDGDGVSLTTSWAGVTHQLFGAAILALTAHWFLRSSRTSAGTVAVAFGLLALLAVAIGVMTADHADSVEVLRPGEVHRVLVSGDAFVVAPQLLVSAYLALAAAAFAQRSERQDDEFWAWLGAGCALAAIASLDDLLFPPVTTGFYTSDVLRIGAVLLWLAGCGREIASYWAGRSQLLLAEERRRIARDLHDGLAQELAFIANQARLIDRGEASKRAVQQLEAAARRALNESRRAIRALSTGQELLEVAVAHAAEEVALREGLRLRLALEPGIIVGPAKCDALVRIVSEAVTNAARHGHASTVHVELTNGDGYRLAVIDDGVGFDPAAAEDRPGFGLVSMRERANAFGADFSIKTRQGAGATIEVAW
jgi:signal transduction histidine kinase